MSSQQLVDDYEQLKKLLRAYPDIFILKATGQPPDNYEIEYSVRGYIKDADDQINIGDRHKIRISLPFGYPHFAPIVKPITQVFHPDVDPAAIRIAEWWAQNPSLPSLVLYIGEMICGKAYSLEDPFNQEAAEWYKTYQNQLPLDELRTLEVEQEDEPSVALDEGGFGTLGLEKSEEPEKQQAVVVEQRQLDETDIQHIHELISSTKIFAANELLLDMPASVPFPEREELQKDIAKSLRKIDQLLGLVEQLEGLKKYNEALEAAESIATIASDAPGLEEIQARLRAAVETEAAGGDDDAQKRRKAQWERAQKRARAQRKTTDLRKILLPVLVLLFLGFCGTVGWFAYEDQKVLESAAHLLNEGQQQIKNNKFIKAKEALEQAQSKLNKLVVLQYINQQAPIQAEIEATLQSRELQEGLKGRILYEGEYVSVQDARMFEEFNELKDKALSLAQKDHLEEALKAYTEAAEYAEKAGFLDEKAALDEHFYPLNLRYILNQAEQAEREGKLNEAAALYRQIQEVSAEGPHMPGLSMGVDQKLSEITFRQEIDASRQSFIKSQWEQTIASLERAQQYALAHPEVGTEEDRHDLQRLLDNARLNMYLTIAKEAFFKRNWPPAIENYNLALALLSARPDSVQQVDDAVISKIERILLQVQIMEQQELSATAESRHDLQEVIKYNQAIQQLIQNSPLRDSPELQQILSEAAKKSDFARKELDRKERIAWLEENYEKIFRNNYATLQGSQLLKPKAVFVKNVGNNPVFSLTCLERDLGRTSKIELLYMFNNATGKWQVYSDR